MFAPIMKAVGKFALPYAVKYAGKFIPKAMPYINSGLRFLNSMKDKFSKTKAIVNEGIDVARKAVDLVPNSSIKDKLNSALDKGTNFVNNAESKAQSLINTGQHAITDIGNKAAKFYS